MSVMLQRIRIKCGSWRRGFADFYLAIQTHVGTCLKDYVCIINTSCVEQLTAEQYKSNFNCMLGHTFKFQRLCLLLDFKDCYDIMHSLCGFMSCTT